VGELHEKVMGVLGEIGFLGT